MADSVSATHGGVTVTEPRAQQWRAALQRIVDWSDCQCEHDTDECCGYLAETDYHCPGCIAALALSREP